MLSVLVTKPFPAPSKGRPGECGYQYIDTIMHVQPSRPYLKELSGRFENVCRVAAEVDTVYIWFLTYAI
jgi:hypothetical protein